MKFSHHRKSRHYNRRITIGKEVWSYRIVGTFVAIRSPDGKTTIKTDAFEINGTTEADWFEQGEFPSSIDKAPNPQVKPSMIRLCIEQFKAGGSSPDTSQVNISNGSEGKSGFDEDPNWFPEGL